MFKKDNKKFLKECKIEFVDEIKQDFLLQCEVFQINEKGRVLSPEEQKELHKELIDEMRY